MCHPLPAGNSAPMPSYFLVPIVVVLLLAPGCSEQLSREAERVEAIRSRDCRIESVVAGPSCSPDHYLVANTCTGEQTYYRCSFELQFPKIVADCMRAVPACATGKP